jgi:hypothetical protein
MWKNSKPDSPAVKNNKFVRGLYFHRFKLYLYFYSGLAVTSLDPAKPVSSNVGSYAFSAVFSSCSLQAKMLCHYAMKLRMFKTTCCSIFRSSTSSSQGIKTSKYSSLNTLNADGFIFSVSVLSKLLGSLPSLPNRLFSICCSNMLKDQKLEATRSM